MVPKTDKGICGEFSSVKIFLSVISFYDIDIHGIKELCNKKADYEDIRSKNECTWVGLTDNSSQNVKITHKN